MKKSIIILLAFLISSEAIACNSPPVAYIDSVNSICRGGFIIFDAAFSTDPDGIANWSMVSIFNYPSNGIKRYEWLFNYNGSVFNADSARTMSRSTRTVHGRIVKDDFIWTTSGLDPRTNVPAQFIKYFNMPDNLRKGRLSRYSQTHVVALRVTDDDSRAQGFGADDKVSQIVSKTVSVHNPFLRR